MKYSEAREELRRVLNEQKTVSVPKLRRLITAMNISLREDKPNEEVTYLKGEIKRLRKENNALRKNRGR
jgi:hypothetical protein